MQYPSLYYSATELRLITARIFEAVGLTPEFARIEAANLVYSDLRGHDAHGVTRIPIYTKRFKMGVVNCSPSIRVEQTSPSAAIIHGDNGPGAVVSDKAMKTTIQLAEESGIGLVVARHSNHNGSCAFFSSQASAKGFIGGAATNAPASMAIWGSRDRVLGTNPFSVAVPAGRFPALMVDMATSTVARGKIVEAAKRGESIPEGLALCANGNPTTDARVAEAGVMLPFGGPKGSAIAILVDVFSGVLSGSAFGKLVNNLYNDFKAPQDNGHIFMAIDPALFMPRGDFLARVDQFIALMKAASPVQGIENVLLPGEPESIRETTLLRTGIPLPADVKAEIEAICDELNLEMPAGSAEPLRLEQDHAHS